MSIEVFGDATASHKSAEGRSNHCTTASTDRGLKARSSEAVVRTLTIGVFTHALPLKTPKSQRCGIDEITSILPGAWPFDKLVGDAASSRVN